MLCRNTILKIAAITSVFLPCSVTAGAEESSIIGTWKGSYAESCKAVEDVSTEDFIKIEKKKIVSYEGECTITRQTKKQDTFELQSLCEAEGEVSRRTMKIKVISRNQISIKGRNYDRCK